MLSVSNVSMRYGAKILFDEVSTAFTPGRRYGLTGPNGAGKSTFMKLLSGELDPQKGTVVRPRKLGVLSQDQFAFDAYRVMIDENLMGASPIDFLQPSGAVDAAIDANAHVESRRGKPFPQGFRRIDISDIGKKTVAGG